jgi:sRNA-binding protein
MCYEERFFAQRATTKVRKREEPKSVIERLRARAQSDRPRPETKKPKEVEPELEIV